VVVGLIYTLCASGGTFHFGQSAYPQHLLIADGWLHGRLSVREEALRTRSEAFRNAVRDALDHLLMERGVRLTEPLWQQLNEQLPPPPVMHDWAILDDKFYGYFGPMPALLLLPYVAAVGLDASDLLISALLGAATVLLIYLCVRQAERRGFLEATPALAAALAVLFGLGTVHFYLTVSAEVWFFSQVVTAFFLSLAIYLILLTHGDVRWPVAAGAAFAAALLARLSVLPTIGFFYVLLLALHRQQPLPSNRRLIRQAIGFSVPVIVTVLIAGWFNYARFGSVLESGLHIQTVTGANPTFAARYTQHGFFSWHYLPRNFYYYFLNPVLIREGSARTLSFDPDGNSMFLVTPMLLYVFRAHRRRDWFVGALWLGAGGSMLTLLLFFGTGWVQFGNRYLLDLMPLAMLLIAVGMRGRLSRTAVMLIALSLTVNAWGTYRFCREQQEAGIVAAYAEDLQIGYAAELYRLAGAAEARGDTLGAVAQYSEAVRWNPNLVQSHLSLANLLCGQRRWAEAVPHYEAALQLDPTQGDAHNNLGVALAEQGESDAAIGHFEQALHWNAANADAHANLGKALRTRGDLPGAIAEYEAALRLRPADTGVQEELDAARRALHAAPSR